MKYDTPELREILAELGYQLDIVLHGKACALEVYDSNWQYSLEYPLVEVTDTLIEQLDEIHYK